MKILVVHNYYQVFGGEDRVTMNEQELLREKGEDVIVFEKNNNSIHDFGFMDKVAFFPNAIHHRKHLRELRDLVEERQPDVAHIHNIFPLISPQIYPVLKSLKVPIIQSFHDHRLAMLCPQGNAFRDGKSCDLCHNGNYLHSIRHKCIRSNLPLSITYAYAVAKTYYMGVLENNVTLGIYFNDYMKYKLIKIGFPEKKLILKPHFIKDDVGLPTYKQDNYAVFIGAVSPHKGVLTLIRAFKDLKIQLRLKIIGNGESFAEINKYIEHHKLDRVEMMGFIKGNERLDILKNAKFSIVPSEVWETFCMSALESLACGVPVIGTNMGSIPYLIKPRETGLLFESGNADDLKNKIEWMCNHPSERLAMGKKGRKVFEEQYTADTNYKRLLEIYRTSIQLNQ